MCTLTNIIPDLQICTNKSASMQGPQIERLSQNCEEIDCILQREALVTKKLTLNMAEVGSLENELNSAL